MIASEPGPAESRIEAGVRRARRHVEFGEYPEALALAQSLLAEVPENRDVLYLKAVAQRLFGHTDAAIVTLARFEALHPDFARLFQERGHCLRTMGDTRAAIEAYERAVTLNGALLASWNALAELCAQGGRSADAETAANRAAQLAGLPAELISAGGLLAEGDIFGAERILRRFLKAHSEHVEAMRLLAQVGVKLDVLDDAEFLLESALVFAPEHHAARYEYAFVLSQRHKHAQALAEVDKLRAVDPRNRDVRTLGASIHVGLGNHEQALQLFDELLRETPASPDLHLSIAHAQKTLGRRDASIESYRAAARARPDFGDAYWSLANLKTYRFTDAEILEMRAQEARAGIALADRYHFCFALGKAYEDRAEYEESFRYYTSGNALKKSECRYDADRLDEALRLQVSVFTREFFAARAEAGCKSPDPIFIVGLPRAGSTLLEQILASHSQVEGTMELADIPRLAMQLGGRERRGVAPRYPGVLGGVGLDALQRMGEQFLSDTRVYRSDKRFFIDKMPNNFRHIGLIHSILPNAKIIDARREPIACCFSNFKQLFASGQEFTYGLQDLARYYRGYVSLMEHWDRVLPGRILRVRHEDVVADLEGSVRRLLQFCDLDFEPHCLEFYKTERAVRTASSEQVRNPIFRDGLDQWRRYEPWLGELKRALGPLASA